MTDQSPLMMRYLLGELSERERDAFEARYFEDPQVFAALVAVENVLVDDYVRGQLTSDVRRQFETYYLADAARRERVRFAEALVTTIDRTGTTRTAEQRHDATASGWVAWLGTIRKPRLALSLATAVVLAAVGIWLFVDAQRAQRESATTAGVRPAPDGAIVPPTGTPPTGVPAVNTTPPSPDSPPRPVVAVATLALIVGPGERAVGSGEPPTLTIPRGTEQVRLALTLREHDHARYRVIVRAIGGDEVVRQSDLIPAAGAQPALSVSVPAARFEPGDYMLTLQGADASTDFEDLSQTIFRVTRQP